MAKMLISGLPEVVADNEDLSRFLRHRSHISSSVGRSKPSAFLPHPTYKNTSVFRIGNEPERLRLVWIETQNPNSSPKGVAICKAEQVRAVQLDVIAEEPPPAHANIEGWPWLDDYPELQKARQKEIASQLAVVAEIVYL